MTYSRACLRITAVRKDEIEVAFADTQDEIAWERLLYLVAICSSNLHQDHLPASGNLALAYTPLTLTRNLILSCFTLAQGILLDVLCPLLSGDQLSLLLAVVDTNPR